MIVVSKNTLIEEKYSIIDTPLEEPCVEKGVQVTPSYLELV